MQVLITGGTGFVGRWVVKELLARGHGVRALVRPGSEGKLEKGQGVEVVTGDVLKPEDVRAAASGCEGVIHLVGIIREFPREGITFERLHVEATLNVVAAAQESGARRYLQMSALGARPAPADPYHVTNYRADQYVMESSLAWTIFRPSLIYGPGDKSCNYFAAQIRRWPVFPVIGDGLYRLQPVPVWIVAQAFARALTLPHTEGRLYEVGGPEALSFNDLIDTLAKVLGKRVVRWHQPVSLVRLAARLLEGFAWFPVSSGQIRMLLEGNICDPAAFYRDFGLKPVGLEEGLREVFARGGERQGGREGSY